MKKLILASIAGNVIYKTEFFLTKPFNKMRVAYLPTAAHGEGGDTPWLDEELNAFRKLGFQLTEVNLEGKNENQLRKECKNIDAVLVCGGNTYYLLEHVRKSGFDKVVADLVEQGVVYIGTSAGSVLAGATIDVARNFDDPAKAHISDYSGLKFVDFAIVPHIDEKKYSGKLEATLGQWKDAPVNLVGLANSQALLVKDNYIELIDAAL
ncbi:MAG: Type 1 glutamine amidotransferase-like domain-containing protein [Patescibacteria group bacterium]|jgi:dipeptidase E